MATAVYERAHDQGADDQSMSSGQVQEKLSSLVSGLEKLAADQVSRKSNVETRWLEDLRAFHGRYDETTESELRAANKSRAFVKITRKKTNSWEARLSALLFPTDEDNWDIMATPVPTLASDAKRASQMAQQQVQQANQQQDPAAAQQQAQVAQANLGVADQLKGQIEEAKRRVEAMRNEMRDQLVECDYPAECRLVIRDACRLGTGILKGPLAGERSRGSWVQIEGSGYEYHRETDPAPVYKWTNPWNYFPDMSALRAEDREFEFERHLWSAKDLRKLARERGFNTEAVRELLRDQPKGVTVSDTSLNYLTQLRSITGTNEPIKDRFVGWEYHGPLSCEDVALVLRALGHEDAADEYETNDDPLHEVRVIAYFCNGKLLKMSPAYPLDSGESLYSIFTLEESEGSLFGYGIPFIMSDSQKSMNGAWRMALDNAGLSVGPQIFIDRDSIQPANGSWELTPRKIWYKKKGATVTGTAIEMTAITNNVEEIMNIVQTARKFIDDETALPVQAEGEMTDNPNITATATNFMSLASNVTFRRVVKNYDDGITVPSIRRLYDWNMQHNDRTDIKGDMKVDARGSGALLQRELQAQMLLNIAQNWTTHPLLGKALRDGGYEAIVDCLRSASIQPDVLLASKEDFLAAVQAAAQQAQQAAQQQQQQDPAAQAIAQSRLQVAQLEAQSRLQVADMNRQTELMRLSQQYNLSVEKLKTLLSVKDMDVQHKERIFAAEVAVEDKRAAEARAHGEQPKGSGGYVSE